MTLARVIRDYIQHKRSLGMVFGVEEVVLRSFCKAAGNSDIAKVSAETVRRFLDGTGPVTGFWSHKYRLLAGLYKYAAARRYVVQIPLPSTVPQVQRTFQPYIYTPKDVRRLLDAALSSCVRGPKRLLEPHTLQTLILLLYSTGLRIGEVVGLTLDDFDHEAGVLFIRETKFFKSRVVPVGSAVHRILSSYVGRYRGVRGYGTPLLRTRDNRPVSRQLAEISFSRLRKEAGVSRPQPVRYQPRLHDFRHTFAVRRLVTWYRKGKDVQRLLPHLSTYLGHYNIASTQHYLTMTAELLQQASLCFERYAKGEVLNA